MLTNYLPEQREVVDYILDCFKYNIDYQKIFGDCTERIIDAVDRSSLGKELPNVEFEIHLTGTPKVDTVIAYKAREYRRNRDIECDMKDDFKVFFDIAEHRNSIILGGFEYDTSNTVYEEPSVLFTPMELSGPNSRWEEGKKSIRKAFAIWNEEQWGEDIINVFDKTPEGSICCGVGIKRSRVEAPSRLVIMMPQIDEYEPHYLEKLLRQIGYSYDVSEDMIDTFNAVIVKEKLNWNLELDIMPDGSVGSTVGIDIRQNPRNNRGGIRRSILDNIENSIKFASSKQVQNAVNYLRKTGRIDERFAEVEKMCGFYNMPYVGYGNEYKERKYKVFLNAIKMKWNNGSPMPAKAYVHLTQGIMTKEAFAGTIGHQWHITDTCDQRCKHCYIFAEDNAKNCVDMPWEQMMRVVDKLEEGASHMDCEVELTLTGGDPILHPRFWDLAEELHRRGIVWTILGNPFHLTNEVCDRLRQLGCNRYQMSIDGLEATHDMLRKPGSYAATLKAIPMINQAGIDSLIMATVSKLNYKEIPELVDIVAANDVSRFAFARYCPTADDKVEDSHIEPDDFRQLMDTIWKRYNYYEEQGCKTIWSLKDHLWTLYRYEIGDFTITRETDDPKKVFDGCHCGQLSCILANGDIYACRRMESKIGSIIDDYTYEGIYQTEEIEKYRDYESIEKCSECELLKWCRGCRAVAYGYTGDWKSADPQCWKECPNKSIEKCEG